MIVLGKKSVVVVLFMLQGKPEVHARLQMRAYQYLMCTELPPLL